MAQLPTHARITLEQFLEYTGWNKPVGVAVEGMRTALSFYQDKIPRNELLAQVDRFSDDPRERVFSNPWSRTKHGPVVKLVVLMQAINFSEQVVRRTAKVNNRFIQVRKSDEKVLDRPKGNWFTWLSTDVKRLGLPGNQSRKIVYVVVRSVEGLESTVADAYTWEKSDNEPAVRYFRGGGKQFFVWEPDNYFKLA